MFSKPDPGFPSGITIWEKCWSLRWKSSTSLCWNFFLPNYNIATLQCSFLEFFLAGVWEVWSSVLVDKLKVWKVQSLVLNNIPSQIPSLSYLIITISDFFFQFRCLWILLPMFIGLEKCWSLRWKSSTSLCWNFFLPNYNIATLQNKTKIWNQRK